ncbi:hypothetical protein PROFUN_04173 [Planoprotostelium fungivorum]|uniref:Ubiquitin-like domain-containing protein n=1 Tax=Planoprotostelium fungivorum TaxID=1890364 RepID=A0A2P6NVU0_9EUKA|nr:hypothetical protein PROFUN_04173 [Planoprotostelium fungivorum]
MISSKSLILPAPSMWIAFAENGLSDRDVWEGDPQVFPIFYQFKDTLKPAASGGKIQPLPLIATRSSVILGFKKTYRVTPDQTVGHLMDIVSEKMNIVDSSRLNLSTLRGFALDNGSTLSSYGFGIIFPNWELRVTVQEIERPKTTIMRECAVRVKFPPLVEFKGLSGQSFLIDISSTPSQLIASICEKFNISDPERFVLATDYQSSMSEVIKRIQHDKERMKNVIFETFVEYGLGPKSEIFDTRMIVKQLINRQMKRDVAIPNSKYRWVQMEFNEVNMSEATNMILALESQNVGRDSECDHLRKRLEGSEKKNTELMQENERLDMIVKALADTIQTLQGDCDAMEDEQRSLSNDVEESQRENSRLYQEHQEVLEEREDMMDEILRLKNKLEMQARTIDELNRSIISKNSQSSGTLSVLQKQLESAGFSADRKSENPSSHVEVIQKNLRDKSHRHSLGANLELQMKSKSKNFYAGQAEDLI